MEGGTGEEFEKDPEHLTAREEMPVLIERTPETSKEKQRKGAKVSKSKEELSRRSEEKEPKKTYELQITEDLDEFVESVSEIPKASPQEAAVKPEKTTRKKSSDAKADSKTKPVIPRKKIEPSSLGPVKEDMPWEGVTLNKCLIVASFVALLSMGFQILQDAVELEDEVLEADTMVWTQPESSPVEDMAEKLTEPWFFESWFGSSKEEPEVINTEAEEIPSTDIVLKETLEKVKSPENRTEEDEETLEKVKTLENRTEEDKEIPAKLKQTHKLEKPKLQRAPKRYLHPKEEEVKSSKIWKPSKDYGPKKEDKHFLKTHGEGKAKLTLREVKGQPFFKKGAEGKPHYTKNPENNFKREHGRFHKARENNSHDYRAHKEHKDYRRREHKSDKPFEHDKFFPKKDKKEEFYTKHRHEESRRHD